MKIYDKLYIFLLGVSALYSHYLSLPELFTLFLTLFLL